MNGDAILAADVGGTHARFGIVERSSSPGLQLRNRLDLEAGQFPGFLGALHAYIEQSGLAAVPRAAAIAVAGPVTAGRAEFTNRDWSISESELRELGFADVLLINDFAALACSLETLAPQDSRSIGPELQGMADSPISIVGAGTGFGVSCLARHAGRTVPLNTEGGHIGFAPNDDQQIAILRALQHQFGRVSVERILSGPGLENLYRAQQMLAGRKENMLTAAQLTAAAMTGDADCRLTLSLFCSIFGSVAGDIALAHGARGGVFLAGGIAQKIETFLLESSFRQQFDNKGRLSAYVRSIPTRLLTYADAALRGAARAGLAAWEG